MKTTLYSTAFAALFLIAGTAAAQEAEDQAAANEETAEAPAVEDETTDTEAIADRLNAQQQIKRTYTLKRTINGKVVETATKSVTVDPDAPRLPTEAGESVLEEVRAAFDSEVLTRPEAFEEAKLDFTIADTDHDGRMTRAEFLGLVDTWRKTGAKQPEASPTQLRNDALAADKEARLNRQFESLFGSDEETADPAASLSNAEKKFAYMSGAAPAITREDYIREYLLDFDTMDVDGDALLEGDELLQFRAANRGEAIEM